MLSWKQLKPFDVVSREKSPNWDMIDGTRLRKNQDCENMKLSYALSLVNVLHFSNEHAQVLEDAIGSRQNLLFSSLKNPNSLGLSAWERCSCPKSIISAFLWTHSGVYVLYD
ncbi:hypothetical protein DUI87_07998 [Hirundo rustica rustica]|uniref:Uncharacterized protein n=1 Tax=Hirundo rustica rustica TaxID=333673 RepID=A0A3M0KWI3_HIRRU|nr:hypothetical protein DUI87_07998 [Hirundo rustica rustica]